ncbi:aminotransferase class I/II-fold pyridoxal phosphate-dependent enzyme [Salmonella enterica]|nr:aminotransferase class I/II-fold pyridoxal phosphate-dependent enzyme [Salmonella enterica]
MSASQNKKKTLSLGLALIPVISMLLLLIIGYGIMGLRIEPLLLCSAAVAAGIAWWQGYCWEDIINSVVDKLAKAMPVIMILICVGGLIGTWMFSGTIPYMVYWGLKLISPEYILIAAFFLTSVVSVCTGTSWGSAGTVGVALMGVAAGLDVSLAAAAGAVVSGAYFGDKISPLSDSTNFAAIVADTTLFEHIQHLLWTTLPSFLLAAVVYLIAGHSNMLGEVATPQRVTDIIHSLESLYHFNIILILPPVIVLWGAIRKKPVIPLMLSACVLALFLGVIMQGLSIKQGLDAFIDGFDLGERWHKRVISATAASKTFGLSSLRISNFLIPDPTLRQRFLSRLDAHGLDVFNALSVQAATTAWNESRQWLDSLLDYLAENRRWFVEQATEHLPWARIVPAQGTYLLWMDCKKLGLDDEQLKWVMADVAGIAPSMGSGFGPAGSGFIRLNLGCPRTYLEMAIDGLKRISVKTIKGIPTGG